MKGRMQLNGEAPLNISALFPIPFGNRGVGHTCYQVCKHLAADGMGIRMYTPRAWRGGWSPMLRETLPLHLRYLPWRLIGSTGVSGVERTFERDLGSAAAYLWSEPTLALSRRLAARGTIIIREKYNCHKAVARRILDDAYERAGLSPGHTISEAAIDKEREEFELASAVVCPSDQVRRSLLSEGVKESKLIDSSYGWSPERFTGTSMALPEASTPTVVFVGYICVRKGAHILLRAWEKASPKARLVLVGRMEPAIAKLCASSLARSEVTVLPFTDDVGAVFRSADVFAFPSLEEGDPLVSYEAMGHGLAMLVSPMGAGRGVRHNVDGLIVDPHQLDAWSDALTRIVESHDLRSSWSRSASLRASEFTWQAVGARLHKRLSSFLDTQVEATPGPAPIP